MHRLGLSRSGLDHPLAWICVIAATLITLMVLQTIWWLAFPFVLSIVFYYISAPGISWFQTQGLSRVSSLWLFLSIVTGLIVAVVPFIVTLIADGATQTKMLLPLLYHALDVLYNFLTNVQKSIPGLADIDAADYVQNEVSELVSKFTIHFVPFVFDKILNWVPSLLLTPYIAFFFLRDGFALKKLMLRGVPNAFFERTLRLFARIDIQIQQYFKGMMLLTLLDTLTLALGLWILGLLTGTFSLWMALLLGAICGFLAWIPVLGSIAGCILVVFVSLSLAPENIASSVGAVGLFLGVRLLEDFVFIPLTIGRSLSVHPLLTVLVILVGGIIGGLPGLLLAMPVLGIYMVIGEMLGEILMDHRLRARHSQSLRLQRKAASEDLTY